MRWIRFAALMIAACSAAVTSHAQSCLRTVNVANSTALATAVASALPGDCIVLADGNYSGFNINVSGTSANPITIRAANRGLAVITSGTIRFNGVSNVVVEGLRITTSGGSATVGSDTRRFAVWFNSAVASRVTRCTFALSGQSTSTYWVFLSGTSLSNRIDHCEFGPNTSGGNKYIFVCGNRPISGVTPPADRTSWAEGNGAYNPNMARHTRIDHNWFRDKASGTGEVMDFGGLGVVGDYQHTHTVAEYNLFENCDGDAEIVAVKSSSNIIRYNTVRTSAGMLSLRAGNNSEIYGNFMFQGGKAGTGGIKIYERDHKVYNNYIEGTQDYPLLIGSGDSYDPNVSPDNAFGHAQVFRAWMVHNTVVNCARQVRIGHGSTDQLPPTDCVFANNLIVGASGATLFSQNITPVNMVYSQNMIWPQNPNRAGFIVANPLLTPVDGIMKLSSGSPAINAANASYFPFINTDVDGQDRLTPDIGADEFSAATILVRPLTTNDVGPNAVEGGMQFMLSASPSVQNVLPGGSVDYTATVTALNGTTGVVSLAVSGLPPNTGASFNPASVTNSGGSIVTINASNAAPFGTFALTITGTASNALQTAAATLTVGDFSLSANPTWQPVIAGTNATITVTLTTNSLFSGSVTFDVTGLPAGVGASFAPPSRSTAGTTVLTLTTTEEVVQGDYPLTITGTGGAAGGTAGTMATLNVTGDTAEPGILFWIGTNQWSTAFNWTNYTAGGFGAPGPANDVVFTNRATAAGSNVVNSVIDTDTTINSLVFANTNSFQNVLINPGRTLTITGSAPGYQNTPALNVGQDITPSNSDRVRASFTGAGGTLVIDNTNASVQVRQGLGSGVVGPQAVLDMSNLGNFQATIRRVQLGSESGSPRRVSGVWALALTNVITIVQALDVNTTNFSSGTPALILGHNTQAGNTNGSVLYLGITNAIFVNHVVVGRGNQTNNLMAFNPIYLASSPRAYFRGSDGESRVGQWTIGDNTPGSLTGPSSGTNDFTGGIVDAMIDRLFIGRGRTGTTVNTGIGTLTFDAGVIDVNMVRLGTMIDEISSTNASGVGAANVNGSGTLIVNQILELAHTNVIAPASAAAVSNTRGTLNLNGGTVQTTNIVGAGGTAIINLNSGTLELEPDWATGPGRIANISTLNIGGGGGMAVLANARTISAVNPITIGSNGVLRGNTTVSSPGLTVNGTIAPGASVGTLTNNGTLTLGAGGKYAFEMSAAVAANGRDLVRVNGSVDVQSTVENPFAIHVQSLEAEEPGPAGGFDSDQSYDWEVASVSGGIGGFDPAKFAVNAALFENDLEGGYFFVRQTGTALLLSFTNNHPPVTGPKIVYRAGETLVIPIADVAMNWSDADGDPVTLVSVSEVSTNGGSVGMMDETYIYYTNAAMVVDAIEYVVGDVRTNAPTEYRSGDTPRTAVGWIQVVPLPEIEIEKIELFGGHAVLRGSGGSAGLPYQVWSSTNVGLPLSQWTVVATNLFDESGGFAFTNAVGGGQRFFRLGVETGQ